MAERQEEMDEEEYKTLIRLAFGESSSDSEEEDEQLYGPPIEIEDSKNNEAAGAQKIQSIFGDQNNCWERFSEINGLSLCRDFLTADQQSSLLSAIHEEGWCVEASHNQAMRFGDLPAWANELSILIREVVYFGDYYSDSLGRVSCDTDRDTCLFPSELLFREPLFNQLIINSYQPGEGICAHVDLMRFEDGIALISLESSCLMHFSRVENEVCGGGQERTGDSPLLKVPVYLTPGSLLLMSGEARYNWKHEINRKPGIQIWEEREIDQKRRISITLRKLFQSGKLHLYPHGDLKTNADASDHISVNLVVADREILPFGWEINVNFRLFMYDHNADHYLTLQDIEGRVTRFNHMRTVRGFAKFISHAELYHRSNGYWFDDSIFIGAEVFIIGNKRQLECLSAIRWPAAGVVSCKLSDFSKQRRPSHVLSAGRRKWKLEAYSEEVRPGKNGLKINLRLLNAVTYFGLGFMRWFQKEEVEFFPQLGDVYA